MTKPIYTCLWFNGNAKEANDFYRSIFKEYTLISENPFTVIFEINNTRFMALNGGPEYTFSPATSFVITCDTQEEIDHYWEKLGEYGTYNKCGWLTDKFGVSWQVVPSILGKLMSDPEKAPKAMYAFMQMTKFEIDKLIDL
jgi:predicted 3-demethylubiquinone-9 3-methyltransferase (glyoxalase superfamily)